MVQGSFLNFLPPAPAAGPTPGLDFLLDGLDEIARRDADFPGLPYLLSRPNVVWLCAGRPEGALPETLSERRCTRLFGGSLPPMSDAGIRGMLLDRTGALKCDLPRLDREHPGGSHDPAAVTNAASRLSCAGVGAAARRPLRHRGHPRRELPSRGAGPTAADPERVHFFDRAGANLIDSARGGDRMESATTGRAGGMRTAL